MIEPESSQRGQQSIFLVWEDGSSWAVSFSAPGCLGGLLITESALLVLTRTPGPSPDHVRVWNSPKGLRTIGFKTTQVVFVISFVNKSGSLRLCDFSVQFISVAQSCPTLCIPMDCSTPGFAVHHQHPELAQTHVLRVSDAIQPSHPQLSPSPPAFNLSQCQGLFQWVFGRRV